MLSIKNLQSLKLNFVIFVLLFTPTNVFAESGVPTNASGVFGMAPLLIVVTMFYFFVIRPQQKKQKDIKSMLDSLSVGDTILTSGGIICKISDIDLEADTVTALINDKDKIVFYRRFVTDVIENSVMKNNKESTGKSTNVSVKVDDDKEKNDSKNVVSVKSK